MNFSIALLLGYFLGLLLLFLLTIIVSIIWLCEAKPRKSQTCTNTLLIVASISAAFSMLSLPVLDIVRSRKEIPDLPPSTAVLSAESRADIKAGAIVKSQASAAFARRYPALAKVPELLEMPTEKKSQKAMEKFFDGLPADEREKFAIAARQAIFDRAAGKPVKFKVQPDDEDQREFMSLIANIDEPLAGEKLAEAIVLTNKELPDGWFRYEMLSALYKSAGANDELQKQAAAHEDQLLWRMHKWLAGCLVSFGCLLAGLGCAFAMYRMMKQQQLSKDFDNPLGDCSYKQVYGQALLIFYIQLVLGAVFGAAQAMMGGSAKTSNDAASLSTLVFLVINLVTILITAQQILCKPLGLDLIYVLKQQSRCSLKTALSWSVCGFFVFRTINFIFFIAVLIAFKYAPSSANAVDHQIVNSAIQSSVPGFLMLWISGAILAPIAEEFSFRGILYTVVRKRLGVFWGIVISAAIFAGYHFDLGMFPSHFIVGVGLAFIYERTRSLVPCILTHALWNSSVTLMAWLMI
ncbi:MAG: CPBP family intramembrane metalloprotease [Cyanobacteria bacterium SZAS LIN-2]|nr:CPBP family intramembrane metalloprotease [Cyanobacteria bacterium SZAS LIN-3]MBS1995587.1 CPBP family intramembrane metalloprotease [Cyanobacteria bacterium SZAS LIN-2]